MHIKAGQAPRRYSLRALALRTAAAIVSTGLVAALFVSLLRSSGLQQQVSHTTSKLGFETVLVTRPDTDVKGRLIPASIYDTPGFLAQLHDEATERLGLVSRLQSSVEHPLGAAARTNELCRPFDSSPSTVALVGNGPLSEKDRSAIEACDIVIRFNLMNNWQRFREKLDVWIMRYSKEASAGYWGITNINKPEASKVISQLKGAWLVGGYQVHADKLLRVHPDLEGHHPVLMPESPMNKAFAADILASPKSYPSTGFVGIQAVLHCTQPTVRLHIFGFNWSKKTWRGHNVDAERAYIESLERKGRAVIHRTACSGMRECGTGDVDASCHWSSSGRYMCLRGKPRKWIDLTSMVSDDRQREFRANSSWTEMPPAAAN